MGFGSLRNTRAFIAMSSKVPVDKVPSYNLLREIWILKNSFSKQEDDKGNGL